MKWNQFFWTEITDSGKKLGHLKSLASRYFFLLKAVKYQSMLGNICISFYEGLHQHSALMVTLLSSVFDTNTNIFKYKSLTADFFKQQQLVNFKSDTRTPHKCLNDIIECNIEAPMLTKPFNIKGVIPRPIKGDPPQRRCC
jgi:hypothetical protein